jgi:hypothetical protein
MQLYSCSWLRMGLVCMVVSIPTRASPGTEPEVSKVIQCTDQSEDRVSFLTRGFGKPKGNGCLKNGLENFTSTAGTTPSRLLI